MTARTLILYVTDTLGAIYCASGECSVIYVPVWRKYLHLAGLKQVMHALPLSADNVGCSTFADSPCRGSQGGTPIKVCICTEAYVLYAQTP